MRGDRTSRLEMVGHLWSDGGSRRDDGRESNRPQRASQIGTIVSVSTQIAVRLPDELVDWIDEQVRAGAGSRAAVTTKALRRYQRLLEAERDAEIYRRAEPETAPMAPDDRTFPVLD